MQAVILAAGKSTRTYPLTVYRPKVLLKVANKTLLEHNLDQLEGMVDEAILIVGFKKEMITEAIGDQYKNIAIKYVEQKEQLGTGHALLQARDLIHDRFLMLAGDDLYSGKDIKKLIKYKYAALAKQVADPSRFGVFITEGQKARGIVEKPKEFVSDLANTSCYVLDKDIFTHLTRLETSERGELELTDAIHDIAASEDFFVETIQDFWLPIGYPWNLLEANAHFLNPIEQEIKGTIEENVFIKGNLVLGKGSVILSGSYIEGNVVIGKNCKIGPNAYIRGLTCIGDSCRIGPAEISSSIFFDECRCDHAAYVGDSILGEKAHLGAHTVVANLRHDGKNPKSMVKGTLIDTGRRKLGAILGDRINTGINTLFYPGRKMWPDTFTRPGEIVTEDIVA
ncbi:MAG: NTP transferase domain-containing protein [Deltaproteobacteria bacterium]|nr:NTP transferase domain-containing protein [Deltaproteobacteria bacterium]